MLDFIDYTLLAFGLVAIIFLFITIYANWRIIFDDYGIAKQTAENKRLIAENQRLEEVIKGKNETITNLLNKNELKNANPNQNEKPSDNAKG